MGQLGLQDVITNTQSNGVAKIGPANIPNNSSGTEEVSEKPTVNPEATAGQKDEPQTSVGNADPADVLYCLAIAPEGQTARRFYKDQPWKGIKSGLPDFDAENDTDTSSVLIHTITADGDAGVKKENTPSTWRDQPADLDVRRDVVITRRYEPDLTLCSKRLVKIMELLMDYYPAHLGSYDYYDSDVEDTFVEIMYFYGELKAYMKTYLQSEPANDAAASEFGIGNCGDESFSHIMEQKLDFGSLDPEQNPCDVSTARDLAVLLRVLAPMYRVKVVPTLCSIFLEEEPRIKYDALWLLMKPGTVVYVQESAFTDSIRNRLRNGDPMVSLQLGSPDDPPDDNERVACVVSSWKYKKKKETKYARNVQEKMDRMILQLWYIEYNGHSFVRMAREAMLCRFDGFRLVSGLEVIPADLHDKSDQGQLRERLKTRGRRYLSILNEEVAHREYHHLAAGYSGQIIVDPVAYVQYAYKRDFGPPRTSNRPFPIVDGDGGRKFRHLLDFQPSNSKDFPRIEEVYALFPRRIQGLGLKTKHWMYFEIDYITDSPPKFSANQLDNELVLISDDDRDVLRTVLPRGEKSVSMSSDFVPGKGEGKIFLLYGPPGTGKTLTAECVANDTRRPLISLTAQDIGLGGLGRNSDAEAELRKWFTVAAKWDAILLIDEADLFLEQRRDGDATRNGLATVFLRSLEYYKGVLFLTTNRPGHIDDSFISRITCPIAFKTLTSETKSRIVRKFIRKFEETGTIEVEKAAEAYLIENSEKLNGRQIRNVLQSAVASAEVHHRAERQLAAETQQKQVSGGIVPVRRHHVKAAVERQDEFRLYLESLKGGRDEPTRARTRQDYLSKAWNGQDEPTLMRPAHTAASVLSRR